MNIKVNSHLAIIHQGFRGGWLIEHAKHLFSLKGFFSTFMELCLKKINTDT